MSTTTTYSPGQLVAMAWDNGMAKADEFISQTEGYFDDAMGLASASAQMTAAQMTAETMSPGSISASSMQADSMSSDSMDESSMSSSQMTAASLTFVPDVVEPDVTIPQTAAGASLELFQQWTDQLIDLLSDRYASFITTYFPNDCAYLEAAEQWICNAITNGGTGIKPAVEQQIWERDRSRLLRDAARAEQEVISQYAARGFPMPSGAMQQQLANIQADTRNQMAQASRDVAIAQAQMEVENVRFAVQQATALYSQLMEAARGYIGVLASLPGISGQIIPSITDSQSRLITAASSYYQSRIAVQELKLKALQPNSEYQQQANVQNLQAQLQAGQQNLNAKVQAAQQNLQASMTAKAQNLQASMQARSQNLGAEMQVAMANLTAQNEAGARNLDAAMQAGSANLNAQMQANSQNLNAMMQTIRNKVDVAVEAARALATDTAAMLNALHVSTSTSAGASTSVGYSYGGDVSADVAPIASI